MTTELEKQFFDTFGIKARIHKTSAYGMSEVIMPSLYPRITDKILLKLICYMTVQQYQLVISNKRTVNDLKAHILKKCIKDYSKSEYLKHQVQQLFEERENNAATSSINSIS